MPRCLPWQVSHNHVTIDEPVMENRALSEHNMRCHEENLHANVVIHIVHASLSLRCMHTNGGSKLAVCICRDNMGCVHDGRNPKAYGSSWGTKPTWWSLQVSRLPGAVASRQYQRTQRMSSFSTQLGRNRKEEVRRTWTWKTDRTQAYQNGCSPSS